ncbi:MAG: hypothetical protein Dasosvirus4_28 [Dasosvirus sp.]|uniref:Uncharacterized protein n=1 Tax=Dasosvirus sp. TaxID=2487764 RepID=A0A3G4ZRI7_9VIRU|nr:MAG: hypothetical protein Dasosvirus4_28 [Dasosvirus sp.]
MECNIIMIIFIFVLVITVISYWYDKFSSSFETMTSVTAESNEAIQNAASLYANQETLYVPNLVVSGNIIVGGYGEFGGAAYVGNNGSNRYAMFTHVNKQGNEYGIIYDGTTGGYLNLNTDSTGQIVMHNNNVWGSSMVSYNNGVLSNNGNTYLKRMDAVKLLNGYPTTSSGTPTFQAPLATCGNPGSSWCNNSVQYGVVCGRTASDQSVFQWQLT